MQIIDIIKKKRDNLNLNKSEIDFFIKKVLLGEVADYQISAFLMAVYLNGMDYEESVNFTESMYTNGDTIEIPGISDKSFDKHSTGGIGDKISLILIPLMASLGIPAVKMSGRGLGITGGTLDKLESIPGFNINLSNEQIISQAKEVGAVICAQTSKLAPADKIFYELRDVTATVDSIPLIASSIMSKKLAIKNNVLVIDLKVGKGAFMHNIADAKKLGLLMKSIAEAHNRKCTVLLSNMDEPIGYTIGNSLEVIESIQVLSGEKQSASLEIAIELGKEVLSLSKNIDKTEAENMIIDAIKSGKAINKFKEIVKYQGGDISYIDNTNKFKLSNKLKEVYSDENGYVYYDALEMGEISLLSGAGRAKKEDSIDFGSGILINKCSGSKVNKGDLLYTIYSNLDIDELDKFISSSYTIKNDYTKINHILEVI